MCGSEQGSFDTTLALCPADIPGAVTRLHRFIGSIGTTPAVDTRDSHDASDFAPILIDSPRDCGIPTEALAKRTVGHMDIDSLRFAAVLICPVKLAIGGVCEGDALARHCHRIQIRIRDRGSSGIGDCLIHNHLRALTRCRKGIERVQQMRIDVAVPQEWAAYLT